jgi:Na+/H+ antiporter NhaB
MLALMFCVLSAFLSAFLDALTVTAVIISAAVGFYSVPPRGLRQQPASGQCAGQRPPLAGAAP